MRNKKCGASCEQFGVVVVCPFAGLVAGAKWCHNQFRLLLPHCNYLSPCTLPRPFPANVAKRARRLSMSMSGCRVCASVCVCVNRLLNAWPTRRRHISATQLSVARILFTTPPPHTPCTNAGNVPATCTSRWTVGAEAGGYTCTARKLFIMAIFYYYQYS